MSPKLAQKRYFKLFIPSMLFYVFGLAVASSEAIFKYLPEGSIYVLALIPALGVFGWIYAHMRLIRETDEFIRKVQIEAILYGLCGIMCASTAWGLLEFYTEVPKLPIFFALPGFYFFYGIAAIVLGWKNGALGAVS